MNKGHNDAGQALVFVALGLVVLLGVAGLAVDMGYMRYQKRQLQMLADAAAMAGARQVTACAGTASCASLTTAAQKALTENNVTPTVVATCTPSPAIGTTTLTVKNGPACAGANDPHNGSLLFVETIVARRLPTPFSKLVGISDSIVLARSEAGRNATGSCVYVLSPTGQSLSFTGGSAILNLQGCGINVNSSNSQAVHCTGASSPTVNANPFVVVGGSNCSFNGGASPTTNSLPVTNPLAYLGGSGPGAVAAPTPGSCPSLNDSLYPDGGGNFQPGTYCNQITLNGTGTFVMQPGLYILQNGIKTNSASITLTGNGVSFYVTGGTVNFQNGLIQLTAPSSGTYKDLLFWQAATDNNAAIFSGSSNSFFSGIMYFPTASLTFGGSSNYNSGANFTFIVSNTLNIAGNADIELPPGGLPGHEDLTVALGE